MSISAFEKLKQDIMLNADLGSQEGSGFYSLYCPICNKDTKKTGGFKFEHDKIVYNCFRGSCDSNIVYEEGSYVPKKFRRLMQELGVTIPLDLRTVQSSAYKEMQKELDRELYEKHVYKQMTIPEDWVPLPESDRKEVARWLERLEERKIPLADVYMIERGDYRGNVAVAMNYFDKIIGFDIMSVDKSGSYRYTRMSDNDNLLYIPTGRPEKIMIVVEGLLDAKCFPNTAATLNSRMTPQQAYQIRDSEKWFLPDRSSNNFLKYMKQYPNSKMVIPNWNYKDLNEAVSNLGVMEVATRIREGLISNYQEAKVKYELWREKE